MVERDEFLGFAAKVLGVPVERLSLETTYESIPEWDSIAHLRLVMEIRSTYGVEIPFEKITSITSLWEFWRRVAGAAVKKVVAVDLDGTLWEGVVGEDGVGNIRPKAGFVAELKVLKERGVLLVALSKNNAEDAEAGLSRLEDLSADDFVAIRANWREKAENLVEVAKELNLGVDSFVFVDDNPAERLAMLSRCPGVTVADFPPHLAAYFPADAVTDEDRVKTEQYKAESRRREYLGDLQIRTEVHRLRTEEIPRVAQLSQKANQFNVRTTRYEEADLAAMKGPVFTLHAGDRFGDQGLVAFLVLTGSEIADFVMSCRVAGRGIEERFWEAVKADLRARGLSRVQASWRRSGKNEPVRELFERLGFRLVEETEEEKRYEQVLG